MYKEKEDTWWKWRRWNPHLSECNQFHSLSLISWKHFMLKKTKLAQKWSSILCAPFPGLRDSQTDGWRSLPGVSVMVFVNETSIWVGDQSEPDSVPPLCRWASGGPPRAREQEEEEGWIDSQSELSTHSLLPPAVILVHRPQAQIGLLPSVSSGLWTENELHLSFPGLQLADGISWDFSASLITEPIPIINLFLKRKVLSRVQLFATLWTVGPLSMEFSRWEYWSG